MALKDRLVEIVYDLKDKFTGKISSITGGLREVERTSDRSTKRLEENNRRLVTSFGTIGGALSKLSLGLVVFAATVGKGVTSVKQWIAAANIQERAEVKLATSLKNLAGATEEEVQALKDQASALQQVTGFGDEATISAQAMLATFRLNSEEIQTLTPRLLDMAENARKAGQSNVDLETIAIALGKALTNGIGSLGEYGVAMDGAQKEAFKLADQTGKVAIIAEVLDGNFKGLAEAVGQEYEGAVRKADGAHGDFLETLGKLFTKNKDWIKLTGQTADAWVKAGEGIEGSSKNIALVISALAKSLSVAMHIIRSLWNEITVVFRIGAASVTESIAAISQALSLLTFGEASNRLKTFAEDMRGTTRSILQGVNGDFEDIKDSYDTLLLAFQEGQPKAEGAASSITGLGEAAEKAGNKTAGLKKQTDKLAESLKKAEQAAKDEVDDIRDVGSEAEKTKTKFADLVEQLNGGGDKQTGFTLLNALDALTASREKLKDGDFSGALEDADKIGAMLLDIKESGAAADITVSDLSKQLLALVNAATEGQVSEELVEADEAIAEVDRVKAEIAKLTGQPVDLKMSIDTTEIDKLRNLEPIVIKIRYEAIGGVPTVSDGTIVTDELRNESDKRGFKP